METKTQWAEVCYVPNELCSKKDGTTYRYIAKRQFLEQQTCIPGMENKRLSQNSPVYDLLVEARRKIAMLNGVWDPFG